MTSELRPDGVARIAKSLTEAQRETLCIPRQTSWAECEQAGFPSEIFGPRWCGFAHLSRLGLAVRAYLENEANGRAEQAAELAKFKALAETLAEALDEWVFRYYWRHEGMNTEQARIYAKAQTEMMLRQYKEDRDAPV